MDIKVGDMVSVRHYSGDRLLKGIVTEENMDTISVKLINVGKTFNCTKGEPVVLGFESENVVYIASCDVINIDIEEYTLKLEITSIETLLNKRVSERFPVSFQVEIRIGESAIIHSAIAKNISFTGMLVATTSDFPLYQKLKLSMQIGIPVNLQAIVVRKLKEGNSFAYGLKLVYIDTNTPNIVKRYLATLKREQENFLKKFNATSN